METIHGHGRPGELISIECLAKHRGSSDLIPRTPVLITHHRLGDAGASLKSSTRGFGRASRQKLKEVIASWLVLSVLCPTS